MPVVHTTCLGSNDEPSIVRIVGGKMGGDCPVCGAWELAYKDRFGRITIYPHKQEGQP